MKTFKPPKSLFIPLLLTAAVSLFFFDLLDFGRTLFFRDYLNFFLPMKYLLSETVKSGQIPWWNPYILGGSPFMANLQSGVFYPLNILFYVLPFSAANNLNVILHFILGALFMYMFLRKRGYGWETSLYGALLFVFTGVPLSMVNVLTIIQSMIWAPLIWYFWLEYCENHKSGYLAATSFFGMIQFLGGTPVIVMLTMIITFLYGFITENRNIFTRFVSFAWMGFLSLVLSAFQLLPTIGMIARSTRIEAGRQGYWSMEPLTLLNLFLPRVYFPDNGDSFIMTPIFEDHIPWLLCIYMGAFVLSTAAAALALERSKETLLWGILFAVFTFLAFGSLFPPTRILINSSLSVNAFRVPEKFFWGAFAVLLFLSVKGFHMFTSKRKGINIVLTGLASILIITAVFRIMLELNFLLPSLNFLAKGHVDISPAVKIHLLKQTLNSSLLICGAFFLICLAFAGKKIGVSFARVSLIIVLFIELYTFNAPLNPAISFDPGKKNEICASFPEEAKSLFRIQTGMEPLSIGSFYGIPQGMTPRSEAEEYLDSLVPNTNIFQKQQSYVGTETIYLKNAYKNMTRINSTENYDSKLQFMGALNIKYLITRKVLSSRYLKVAGKSGANNIYELINTFPRSYLADARQNPYPPGAGSVNITEYGANRIEMDVSSPFRSVLVLADNYYPGWKVYVNGREASLTRGKRDSRNVELPPGNHHVVFRYGEKWFPAGAAVSAIGFLLVLYTVFRKSKGESSEERAG